jgi:hypothetical protein
MSNPDFACHLSFSRVTSSGVHLCHDREIAYRDSAMHKTLAPGISDIPMASTPMDASLSGPSPITLISCHASFPDGRSLLTLGDSGLSLSCFYFLSETRNIANNCSRDLRRDELTLSHQPFNLGYECSFIKFVARYSKTFKIKFDHGFTARARVVMWPIGDFKLLFFNRCTR